ncbi:MAG: hypothetical protein ACC656_07090, partial [Candidatus Heimdallarchaeota archaeon]
MEDMHINSQHAETIVNIVYNSVYGNRPSDTASSLQDRIKSVGHHPSLRFYVPLDCVAEYRSESSLDLEEEVDKFIKGNNTVLLLLGNSGSGKSTFCTHLSHRLINEYQKDNNNAPLPVLIRFGTSLSAVNSGELIEKEFERFGLSREAIFNLRRDQ